MLKIYDKNHNPIGYIRKYRDLKRESELSTAEKTLSFTYLAHTHNIDLEYYIQDKTDEYVVKAVRETTDGWPEYTAALNQEELEAKTWETFLAKDATPAEAADLALTGTGWRVAYSGITKCRSMGLTNVNSKVVLQKICTVFMCEMALDSKNKTVYFYEQMGQDKGVYFMRGLNLRKATLSGDTYDYYTRIIPIGKDGLKISDVNGGVEYIENHQYSNKVLTYIWMDNSYEDVSALKEDAEKKLEDMSKPKKAYSVDVRDLARKSMGYSILEYGLGDTVTLIDRSTGIRDKQRIVKMTEYLQEPDKNTCDIANTRETFDELQSKMREAASIIEAAANLDGSINGNALDKVTIDQILHFNEGVENGIQNSSTVSGVLTELNLVKADIGTLNTTTLKTTEADIKYATIESLNVQTEKVHDLEADYGNFKTLNAGELSAIRGEFGSLSTKYATIDLANIATGAIKTAMIDVGAIQTAQIADGAITNLKVAGDLDATKITAGTLAVDRLIIRGTEKSIVYELNNISGALQSKNVDTLNGEILTPRTINADRIIANSITGNEIAAKTITANNIAANSITGNEIAAKAIKAANIDTENLFSQNITAINLHITGNSSFVGDVTANGSISIVGTDVVGNIAINTVDVQTTTLHWDEAKTHMTSVSSEIVTSAFALSANPGTLVVPEAIYGNYASFDSQVWAYRLDANTIMANNGNIWNLYAGTIYEGNTALSAKYAVKAHDHSSISGSAGSVAWANVIGKPSAFTPAGHDHPKITLYGTNTIPNNSTQYDNVANWGAKHNSIHFYTTSCLTSQPSQYGFILNLTTGSPEVHQIWAEQAGDGGSLYHRGGNSNGWFGSWKKVLDSSNYTSYAATSGHTHNYLPLSGGSLTGALKVNNIQMDGTSQSWHSSVATAGGPAISVTCQTSGALVPLARIRTAKGAWGIGAYDNNDSFYIYYLNNTYLANGTNATIANYYFKSDGTLVVKALTQTSDETKKDIISGITKQYESLFMDLCPILHRWRDGDTGIHMGLGAQSVYQTALKYGLDDITLAAIHRGTGTEDPWGIGYTELIPLTIHMTQKAILSINTIRDDITTLRAATDQIGGEVMRLASRQQSTEDRLNYVTQLLQGAYQEIADQRAAIQQLQAQIQARA